MVGTFSWWQECQLEIGIYHENAKPFGSIVVNDENDLFTMFIINNRVSKKTAPEGDF